QRFEIENLSSLTYFAINDEAFVGGSKTQVKTVAKDDIDALVEKAEEQAENFLEKEIVPKIDKNYQLLSQLNIIKLTNSKYSHEVGEESDSLQLKTKSNITYYFLGKDILLGEFMENLSNKVRVGYKIKKEGVVYKISDVSKEDNKFSLEATVKARASQDVKTEDLLKKLKGMSSKNAEDLIRKDYKSRVDIEISNPLPFLKNRFPFRGSNMNVEISYL
ncbi:hypothetical protein HYT32_02340, partial [Candidatus Roizmanbacteria bacterium]|nr:hypothetical protein [Candidatus Roizmanbacteria bacterium]